MTSTTLSTLTGRQKAWLITVAVLPLVILIAARQLGVMSLLRLAVIGGVGVVFLAAVFVRPVWGVLFSVFYVFSGLYFYVPTIAMIATVAVLLVVAALEVFSGERDRVVDPMFWWSIAIFTVLSLQSTILAHFPELSFQQLILYVKCLVLTVVIVHFIRNRDDLQALVVTIFAGAVVTIIFGVVNLKLGLYTEDNVIHGVGLFRFSGSHRDPNEAAGIMCCAIPLGVHLFRAASSRWVRWSCFLGAVILVIGVFSTFSRSAIGALGLVTVGVVLREVRTRGAYMMTLGVVVLAALFAPAYYWARLLELREIVTSNFRQDFSTMLRFDAMTTAWGLFVDNPWTGIGLGNFIQRGATNVISRIVVHNSYLEVLVSVGVFGFLAFLGIFGSGLRQCLRVVRGAGMAAADRSLAYYVGLSLVSIMASSAFLTFQFKYPMWIPLALALALGNILAPRR